MAAMRDNRPEKAVRVAKVERVAMAAADAMAVARARMVKAATRSARANKPSWALPMPRTRPARCQRTCKHHPMATRRPRHRAMKTENPARSAPVTATAMAVNGARVAIAVSVKSARICAFHRSRPPFPSLATRPPQWLSPPQRPQQKPRRSSLLNAPRPSRHRLLRRPRHLLLWQPPSACPR